MLGRVTVRLDGPLIFMGAGDADFLDQARRAAHEIPKAELLLLEEADPTRLT